MHLFGAQGRLSCTAYRAFALHIRSQRPPCSSAGNIAFGLLASQLQPLGHDFEQNGGFTERRN